MNNLNLNFYFLDEYTFSFFVASCPDLNTIAVNVTYHGPFFNGSYPIGTTAHFTCHPGYRTTGVDLIMCQDSGNWNFTGQLCEGTYLITTFTVQIQKYSVVFSEHIVIITI